MRISLLNKICMINDRNVHLMPNNSAFYKAIYDLTVRPKVKYAKICIEVIEYDHCSQYSLFGCDSSARIMCVCCSAWLECEYIGLRHSYIVWVPFISFESGWMHCLYALFEQNAMTWPKQVSQNLVRFTKIGVPNRTQISSEIEKWLYACLSKHWTRFKKQNENNYCLRCPIQLCI